MRDFFLSLSLISYELEIMFWTAVFTTAAIVLAHWVGGAYERKRYFPPRRIPSTGHQIEKEGA